MSIKNPITELAKLNELASALDSLSKAERHLREARLPLIAAQISIAHMKIEREIDELRAKLGLVPVRNRYGSGF